MPNFLATTMKTALRFHAKLPTGYGPLIQTESRQRLIIRTTGQVDSASGWPGRFAGSIPDVESAIRK